MNSDRKTAIFAGVLVIIATVAILLSTGFTGSILGAPDYLSKISANENKIITEALFQFIAIVKGFNPSVIASASARVNIS